MRVEAPLLMAIMLHQIKNYHYLHLTQLANHEGS